MLNDAAWIPGADLGLAKGKGAHRLQKWLLPHSVQSTLSFLGACLPGNFTLIEHLYSSAINAAINSSLTARKENRNFVKILAIAILPGLPQRNFLSNSNFH